MSDAIKKLYRNTVGLEDLLVGEGTEQQTRNSQVVTVTKINAGNLPFDEATTLAEQVNLLKDNYPNITIVADDITGVVSVAGSLTEVLQVQSELTSLLSINAQLVKLVSIADNVVPNIDEVLAAADNAATATESMYDAIAAKMTAISYATQPEDEYVIIYTSNGDGTFTPTTTTDFSALHWAAKASGFATQQDIIVDSLQFSGGNGTQGTMSWNADEETVDLVNDGAILQLGQEIHINVRNTSEADIANGTVLMATGSIGNSGRITVSPYDGTSPAKTILGLATVDMPDGEDNKATMLGKIRGIDTSSFSDGDILYPIAGGALTSIKPTSGVATPIAFVVNSHTSGTLMVRVSTVDENYYLEDFNNIGTVVDFEGALT